MDLLNKQALISYLKERSIWSKKSLGQNFLIDSNVLLKIVESADLQSIDTVLEIGPGLGVLTKELASKVKDGLLLAVEKDFKLVELLRHEFKNWQQVKIIHKDIRQFDLCSIEEPYKVVANIPYYLTSPLIRHLLEGKCNTLPVIARTQPQAGDEAIRNEIATLPSVARNDKQNNHLPRLIVLTVQKEVAERVTAKPGDSNRGLLTIMIELLAEAEIIAHVPRSSFYPEPEVDSAIIRIRPRSTDRGRQTKTVVSGMPSVDYGAALHIAKAGFSAKRRQLHNSLAGGLRLSTAEIHDMLKQARVNEKKRAEDLTIRQWQTLAQIYRKRFASD